MSALRDVAITGVGVVSPLGHTPTTLFDRLLAGESGVAPVTAFDTSPFPCHVAGQVRDFKARDWVANRKNLKLMSPPTRFGLAAVKKAHQAAGLEGATVDPERFGIFVGAGTALGESRDLWPALEASIASGEFDSPTFGEEGMRLISPLWLLKGLSNNVLGFATADLDAQGINQNYCNTAVGGLQAIGEAAWALVEGKADVLLAGGADSAVNVAHFTGFGRLRMLAQSDGPVQPFDKEHDGFVPGEGAAFVALERASHAQARGAKILARVAGYGNACAAHAMPKSDIKTIAAAVHRALETAGWATSDVDLVYAHGSGTPAFDRQEATAFVEIFGGRTPPITSNKGQLGHAVAASGPLSVVCALEAGRRGRIPAIPEVTQLDPKCKDADIVYGGHRETPVRRALIHAAGLGGQTTAIALEIEP